MSQCLSLPLEEVSSLEEVGHACEVWRQCLDSGEGKHDIHIQNLLTAATDVPSEIPPAQTTELGCINPPTEDPLAWDCDCYEEMHKRCRAIKATSPNAMSTCLQAQFCTHKNICPEWAATVCRRR